MLIDDVYSGGKQSDGDYMLMSEAMQLGLFHPRCRHGLGTYYPELEGLNGYETEDNRLNDYGEHNEAHIDNMIQKYKRFVVGCLDPENVSKYRERLDYWEAQKTELADTEIVDNNSESGIINLQIDEFVPCLKDAQTGEILETYAKEIKRDKLKEYTEKSGWNDEWADRPLNEHIFGVFIKGGSKPQGLISLRYESNCTYMASASTAPNNNKMIVGNNQQYLGVGGHLFAVAAEQSIKHTGDATLYGFAANEKVLRHYMEKFGAVHFPIAHEYQFIIEEEDALKLLEKYNFKMR